MAILIYADPAADEKSPQHVASQRFTRNSIAFRSKYSRRQQVKRQRKNHVHDRDQRSAIITKTGLR